MDEAEALVDLVRVHAGALADLPRSEQERALVALQVQHLQAGLQNGMDGAAAREMAERLDGWIRTVLAFMKVAHHHGESVH